MEIMMQEVSNLRKRVKLRIPQSHYALVSELMRERVIQSEYEENDILLVIEIPSSLEYKVEQLFMMNVPLRIALVNGCSVLAQKP
jgi:GTP-binding protein HflX